MRIEIHHPAVIMADTRGQTPQESLDGFRPITKYP
jgi:hypothetical protein